MAFQPLIVPSAGQLTSTRDPSVPECIDMSSCQSLPIQLLMSSRRNAVIETNTRFLFLFILSVQFMRAKEFFWGFVKTITPCA